MVSFVKNRKTSEKYGDRVSLPRKSQSRIDKTIERLAFEYLQASKITEKHHKIIDDALIREMEFRMREIVFDDRLWKVKLALSSDNSLFYVKITEKSQVPQVLLTNNILSELNTIKSLKHNNIMKYIYGIESCFKVYIISKAPSFGTLENFIQNNFINKIESLCQRISSGILTGLDYLHTKRIVHRNIAPWNVFLDEHFLPQIGNFELATVLPVDSEYLTDWCGTAHYSAPEVLACLPYNPIGADIWSLGAVTYEMLSGGRVLLHEMGRGALGQSRSGDYRRVSSLLGLCGASCASPFDMRTVSHREVHAPTGMECRMSLKRILRPPERRADAHFLLTYSWFRNPEYAPEHVRRSTYHRRSTFFGSPKSPSYGRKSIATITRGNSFKFNK